MNPFHAQLKKWEHAQKPKPGEPIKAVPKQTVMKVFRVHERELVAGGEVLWKPVNTEAAKLLSKSSWIHQPPEPEPTFAETKPVKPPKPKMNLNNPNSIPDHLKTAVLSPGASDAGRVESEKPVDVFNAEILSRSSNETARTLSKTHELLDRALDARAAMEELCNTFQSSWLEFEKTRDDRLKEMRQYRMAFDTEARQLMASLREVRNFFMDKDHDKETQKLKEFVELCERLKALKESGFLDTVADTMLKLGS